MHISEGVLQPWLLASGWVVAAAATAMGLRHLSGDRLVKTGMLTAVFYVASLVHVPLVGFSVHLVLNGLLGVLLGWAAVPAILVGLLLQALIFQFGGLTVLGVNTVIMALPAVASFYLFTLLRRGFPRYNFFSAALCGGLAIFMSGALMALFLALNGQNFLQVALLALAAHLPVAVIEAVITGAAVSFLSRVKPEMLLGNAA